MKVRSCVWLLPLAIGWAGADEPKARPRLPPPVVSDVKREAAQPAPVVGSTPSFRTFDDFLQAEARRPAGLEGVPEVAAARLEAAAAETKAPAAKDSAPTPRPDATGGEILVLPKMEVTTEKLTKLKSELAALEANQSWESSSAAAWETRSETSLVLDAILNPPFLKLGGYSAGGRAATARQRVELLRWVSILTISFDEAKTPADKARIQADIDGLKEIMRNWP